MKKLLFAGVLFFLISSSHAQKSGTFGISAGINVANTTFKSEGVSTSFDSRVGFKGYVFYDAPLGKNFSLENELGFDGMGFKFSDPNSGNSFTESVNYITLSVLPKYNVQGTGLSFFIGPAFSFLLDAKTTSGNQSQSETDQFNSVDIFGVVGVSYFLPEGIGLTARYMGGFANIAKGVDAGTSAHNSLWSFTLAYRFNQK